MPKLERLELCDNGIETGFDVIATQYPELKVLKVSGNKIKSLDEIKHLSGLEHLDSLDMVGKEGAAATEPGAEINSGNDEIKTKIREILPKLEVLNGFNKENQEILTDEEDDEDDYEEDEEQEDDMEGDDEEREDGPAGSENGKDCDEEEEYGGEEDEEDTSKR